MSELKKLGKLFSVEMLKISKLVFSFFKKYDKENITNFKKNRQFNKKLKEIIELIDKRIKIEESILFSAYQMFIK